MHLEGKDGLTLCSIWDQKELIPLSHTELSELVPPSTQTVWRMSKLGSPWVLVAKGQGQSRQKCAATSYSGSCLTLQSSLCCKAGEGGIVQACHCVALFVCLPLVNRPIFTVFSIEMICYPLPYRFGLKKLHSFGNLIRETKKVFKSEDIKILFFIHLSACTHNFICKKEPKVQVFHGLPHSMINSTDCCKDFHVLLPRKRHLLLPLLRHKIKSILSILILCIA